MNCAVRLPTCRSTKSTMVCIVSNVFSYSAESFSNNNYEINYPLFRHLNPEQFLKDHGRLALWNLQRTKSLSAKIALKLARGRNKWPKIGSNTRKKAVHNGPRQILEVSGPRGQEKRQLGTHTVHKKSGPTKMTKKLDLKIQALWQTVKRRYVC